MAASFAGVVKAPAVRTRWTIVGVVYSFVALVSVSVGAWPALAASAMIAVAMFVLASRS